MAGDGSGWAVAVLIGTGVCVKDSDVLVGLCVSVADGTAPPELLQEASNETIMTVKINLCMVCNVRLNTGIRSILAYKSDQKV